MRGNGITTVATRGSGDLIRPDTAKTATATATLPGFEGFTFNLQRWHRHPTDSDSKERTPPKEPDLPPGSQLIWGMSIKDVNGVPKGIVWAPTKPLCIQRVKEYLDGLGPDWLEAKLGFPHREEVEESMRVREGDWEAYVA